MRRFPVIVLAVLSALIAGGCAQTKQFTISAKPADADISIDGVSRGRGPITEQFTFDASHSSHRVVVSRLGYLEEVLAVAPDTKPKLDVNLRPRFRDIFFSVQPVPALISVNGKPLNNGEPVQSFSTRLDFTVDARNEWTQYTVRAERPNFQPAQIIVSWPDRDPNYVLNLEPMRKDISITSNPPGANVLLDGESLGVTPLIDKRREFSADPETNEFRTRKLTVSKAGFEPVESEISWDDARSAYHIDLAAKAKTVRIETDPRDSQIVIDDKPIKRDVSGVSKVRLEFPPNEAGELKTHSVSVSKTSSESEWEPQKFTIAWEDGKIDYPVKLKEILTRPLPLLTAVWVHDGAWSVTPRIVETISAKATGEGADRPKPVQLSELPKGTNIDTLTVSPDGARVLFTVLMNDKDDFRSQMFMIRTEGDSGADLFSDGKSLDLTPSFTPDGESIVYSSNRSGRRMTIWEMAASGAPGITQRTNSDSNDLWPVVDWDPRPKLYYQAMIDSRNDPRLFAAQIGNTFRTDMQTTGMQPRISPKNDVIVFTSINDKTGKRDLFRIGANGGSPQNLTGTPDVDEFDPVWNSQGTKIAFTSDAGMDVDKRHNLDIWTLDLTKREGPQQITVNASQDDCPAWDPTGNAIYFRSNRGGAWGIWKISIK